MQSSVHSEFILTDIYSVLEEAINTVELTQDGIEMYPTLEYVLQAVFLRMTGMLEQKMKCICWSLATNDYEYRRLFLDKNQGMGEYSTYDSKRFVFGGLISQIRAIQNDYSISDDNKKIIIKETIDIIDAVIPKKLFTPLRSFSRVFSDFSKKITANDLFILNTDGKDNDKTISMVSSKITDVYNKGLYIERNRIAHNTRSYQKDIPEMYSIVEGSKKSHCYLVYFFILILIDKIFIFLYKDYLTIVANSKDVFY